MGKLLGFNLLELMIAMALAALLSLALLSMYSTVKKVEQIHEAWLQIIDNGRYAVFVLRRDLKSTTKAFFVAATPYKNARGVAIKGLYERQPEGHRELVALDIDSIEVKQSSVTLDLSSEDQSLKRRWSFNV